jgi:hypothetical protein
MPSADPLAQLHDIVLPSGISWWPLAWGWWLLMLLVVGAVALAIFFWRRQQKREAYRQLSLLELENIIARYRQQPSSAIYLQQLSILLRRAARMAQPDLFPVDIKGEAWLNWLDEFCPATKNNFSTGVGRALLTGPYEANPDIDAEALHALTRLWLSEHHNQWQSARTPRAVNKKASARAEQKAPLQEAQRDA